MKFQIKSLIIWPKSEAFGPRIIRFELGALNVITGTSRTGKSAIIPIIDYCLASSSCSIPIDTIRDYASWYGIVVQTDVEQMLLCRAAPAGNTVSNDFYVLRGKEVPIPGLIEAPNQNTDGVKTLLNTVSAVPYFSLSEEIAIGSARLSFRDLMALVFQSQDIVANQNILFYKTHAHEHRQKLRNWFPFILGAENIDTLQARQRLVGLERRLAQLNREWEKASEVSASWTANIYGHLKLAQEYGLLDDVPVEDVDVMVLIETARSVIARNPEQAEQRKETIESANLELLNLEEEDVRVSGKLAAIKQRLTAVDRLREGLDEYRPSVKRRVDRLQLSQWMSDLSLDAHDCPMCGASEHPYARAELEKISLAFKEYEQEATEVAEIPTSFDRERALLTEELDQALEEKRALQNRYDRLVSQDEVARQEFDRKNSMYEFLGHMRASLEHFEKLAADGGIQEEIATLEVEIEELRAQADEQAVKRRLNAATDRIGQGMLAHLHTLDVEDRYRAVAPQFDVSELGIKVQSSDGSRHFLAEVGSASNWVSFHIALMCSLHGYLESLPTSHVPSFTIFDQPSQVYFPRTMVSELDDEAGEDRTRTYEDADVVAVRAIFSTLAAATIAAKGRMQYIVLDHADDAIYGDIEGVHEVENWWEGNKLIPEAWYP